MCACVHTHFVPADNISMLIQEKKEGVEVGGVPGVCVHKRVSALIKGKQLRKRSTHLPLFFFFYFSRASEELITVREKREIALIPPVHPPHPSLLPSFSLFLSHSRL